jgi:hypothetical protein
MSGLAVLPHPVSYEISLTVGLAPRLPKRLLRVLHQPRELLQLDTVQIRYGPIVHA